MELHNLHDVTFFILFFIPGFVIFKIYSLMVAHERVDLTSSVLEVVAFSCINYSICAPVIYLMFKYDWLNNYPFWFAFSLFIIVLLLPISLVFIYLKILKSNWAAKNRILDVHKSSWDFFFSKSKMHWIVVTLKDGKKVAGKYKANSFASSYPHKDIYIEEQWKLNDNGTTFVEPIKRSAGILILENEISYIQFYS